MAKKQNDPPPLSEDLEEAYRGKGCAMPMGGEPNSDYSDQFESKKKEKKKAATAGPSREVDLEAKAEKAEEEENDEKPTPSWARELLHSNRELARSNKEIANEV
ncbi:hypothetical protein LWI28_016262 [Acer negundo]|uniref:Uncharacterized protein n=1 Tax=Acer negundo TaxID=4023 RepID=A0AAD5JGN1_ACENE|nr:hypothetical protein LWI28_016262 [Acer negundo]